MVLIFNQTTFLLKNESLYVCLIIFLKYFKTYSYTQPLP